MGHSLESVFVAVRSIADGDGEVFDFKTLCMDRDCAAKKAAEIDAEIPGWAKDWPVLRIAKVEIVEVDDG